MRGRVEVRSGYLVAALAALAAVAARLALDALVGNRHRFVLLYVATLLVAARHGFRPGLAVVGVGALALGALRDVTGYADGVDGFWTLDLAVFLVLASGIAWLAGSMKRAREEADAVSLEAAMRARALARSEERYRSFIQRSSEGIWRIELEPPIPTDLPEDELIARCYRDGYLAECNDAMARMYGFTEAADMVGMRLGQLLIPTDPANREYLLAFIRSGYRVTDAESHEVDRQGSPKCFLNNLVGVVEHGYIVRAWGTQRDVTESRRTEQALRASEERLRLALEAGRMGIWDWDMQTGAIQWSDDLEPLNGLAPLNRLAPLDGLAPGTFAGTYEAFLALIHPEDRAGFTEAVRVAVETGGAYEAEFRVVTPDHAVRWMLGKGQVFTDVDGRAVRMVGIGVDVSVRKRAEDELHRSVARLEAAEHEVQQLLEREREARADAERSNRAKDEFLATLSHELRSPLSAALSWAHLLRRGQLDAEKTARALETIERTTRLQVRLIEDILDISRIVSGKLTVERGVVDLGAVVEAAADSARAAADGRQIELRIEPPNEVLLVGGDAVRLEQVVGNLLGNAIKFTPAGGRATVAWRRDEGCAEVTVRDTGIGIPADVLPHVFDRFRQADSSTTRRHGGLGLGLAIVRHLVELHHGSIGAESEGAGHGTLVRVRLPLETGGDVRPVADVRRGPNDAQARPLAGVRILVVDDEADIRAFLETILAGAGADVATAESTEAALRALAARAPDLLLSDLAMPDRDGFALLRAVRARGATMPVIALTALASALDRQRALAAGFVAYLVKPVDPPALVARVARVVRGGAVSPRIVGKR